MAWRGRHIRTGDDETARLELTGLYLARLHIKWSEGNGYSHTSWYGSGSVCEIP